MQKEFKFLEIAKIILKVLAWASLCLGALYFLSARLLKQNTQVLGPYPIVGFIIGLFYFFLFYTGSEIIALLFYLKEKIEKGA
jgi:uncharacterized RDD family membrane protein YckC